jgi:hypothetical protein
MRKEYHMFITMLIHKSKKKKNKVIMKQTMVNTLNSPVLRSKLKSQKVSMEKEVNKFKNLNPNISNDPNIST